MLIHTMVGMMFLLFIGYFCKITFSLLFILYSTLSILSIISYIIIKYGITIFNKITIINFITRYCNDVEFNIKITYSTPALLFISSLVLLFLGLSL